MRRIEAAFRHASTQYLTERDGPSADDSRNYAAYASLPETLSGGAPTHPLLSVKFPAGYPDPASTAALLRALSEARVDFIEVSFTDLRPTAGRERASQPPMHSTASEADLRRVFAQVAEARPEVVPPIFLDLSHDTVRRFGVERLLDACSANGVDGLIVADLPLDVYRDDFREGVEQRELGFTFVVTPHTPPAHVQDCDSLCRGWICVQSDAGGSQARGGRDDLDGYLRRLSAMDLTQPRLIRASIANRADLARTTRYAAGGVVGSAFCSALDRSDVVGSAKRFVLGLR